MNTVKRSAVWANFKRVSDSLVTCLVCYKTFKFYGNTSNMRGHLKRKHFSYGDATLNTSLESSDTKAVPTASTSFENADTEASKNNLLKSPNNVMNETVIKINQALVKMIVKDLQPISIIENRGFIDFINALQPAYKLPTRESLLVIFLQGAYNELLIKINPVVNNVSHVAVTTDIWINVYNDVYMTVIAHFLDSGSKKSSVLETVKLENSYTEEDVASVLTNVLTKWNLMEKIVVIISDENPQVKDAVIMHLQKDYFPCVANTLKNCVNYAINANTAVTTLVQKCRTLVNHLMNNPVNEEIKKANDSKKMENFEIKLELLHKWNSLLHMFRRLLQLKETLNSITSAESILLDSSDWEIIEDCIPLLEPFEEVGKELSRERYPGISLIIPLVKGLNCFLKKQDPKTEVGIALKDNLIKIIANDLGILESNPIIAKATLLDPRFKKVAFNIEKNAEMAQIQLMEELENLFSKNGFNEKHNANESEVITEEASSSLWEQFDSEVTAMSTVPAANEPVFSLVKQYLEMPLIHRSKNPLQFWEAQKHNLTELYELSLKYFCIPASSVPPERLFSNTGQFVAERRSLLTDEGINEILFLHGNLD